MKNTKKAVTLVEAVVTLAILAIGLTGVYRVYNSSIRFLDGVASKTQAIQIAREGIEAVENIRDTNWQMFPSNTKNCWNVLNYTSDCITTSSVSKFSPSNTSDKNIYILLQNINGKWSLEAKNLPSTGVSINSSDPSAEKTYLNSTPLDGPTSYKEVFRVKQKNNGTYFQGTGTDISKPNFSGKNFTRRIEIQKISDVEYLEHDEASNSWSNETDGEGIQVTSIVEWRDMSSSGVRRIKLKNLMTNHKK